MVATCIVPGCPTNSLRFRRSIESQGLHFSSFRLPSKNEPAERLRWLRVCGRTDLADKDKGDLRVCARHFENGVRGDIPTLDLPAPRDPNAPLPAAGAPSAPAAPTPAGVVTPALAATAAAAAVTPVKTVADGRVQKKRGRPPMSAKVVSRGLVDVLANAAAQQSPLHDPKAAVEIKCVSEKCRVEMEKLKAALAKEKELRLVDREAAVAALMKAQSAGAVAGSGAAAQAEIARLLEENARLNRELEQSRISKDVQSICDRNDLRRLSEAMETLRSELRSQSKTKASK